jgi:3-oxoacyl-[acyl-carrier protein] reductase
MLRDSMSSSNLVAIVTGAGRGIGEAIAVRLARDGMRVACVSRTESNAVRTANAINAEHSDAARAYTVDVADRAAVAAVCERILGDFGQVDVLVNNAGVTRDGLAMRMSEEDWDVVLDTNLKGAFHFIQGVMRPMVRQRSGRIINISSVAGLGGNAGQANYAASKSGLLGLTKSLALELGSRSITVNAVAPGFINTDMTGGLPEALKANILQRIPLGRFGNPEDVAGAVAFLASAEGRYVTGQTLTVDGGMVM